ncbi:hypothetical protein ACROYT_G031425 [Oculina patagonica]
MALTVVVGFAIIFLSTIQSLHVQHRFESRPFHYLNVSPLETLVANDYIDCSFACLQNVLCVSFNVAVFSDENGKRWCELLPSTSYNNTAKLTADHQSQHYSIQNPCSSTPCMYNGTCIPTSFRDGTYRCACLPGYLGSQCEIVAPECHQYAVLSEPGRHRSYGRGGNSDVSLVPGWYRFQSSAYTKMLDTCISHHRCLTDITGWLNGAHPSLRDGIVNREACFNGYYNCCYRRVQIRVRECDGFYVYELKPAPGGGIRYCTTA